MKKVLFILGAAALVLASCAKSETVVKETSPGEITFKAITTPVTKTGELDGATLTGVTSPNHFGMWVSATLKDKNGNIDYATFLNDQAFGPASMAAGASWSAGSYAGTTPFAFTPAPVYWPIGGVKIDFLAYAMKVSDQIAQSGSEKWEVVFDNESTDIASKMHVQEVNTYDNQVDFMYAAANDQTNQANGIPTDYVHLTFKHAQALLIFNAKKGANSGDQLKINGIHFLTDARVNELVEAAKPGGAAADAQVVGDVTLKTVGTFVVDNSRINLVAAWSDDLVADVDNSKIKAAAVAAAVSPLNATVKGQSAPADEYTIKYGDAVTRTDYSQLGESLLIPEQAKVNFTIEYQIAGGRTYYYTYNDLRGNWEAGKVYIYNLDLSSNEIIITEEVDPFATGATENISLL